MKRIKQSKGNIGMIKVREILRLKEQGLNYSQIAASCEVSRFTIREYLARFNLKAVKYTDIKDLPDSDLLLMLDIKKSGRRNLDVTLDYQKIKQELLRKNVTKQLLWEEHLRLNPEGFYSYSQFCSNIKLFEKTQKICMHQEYKAGEQVQIDYAGDTVPIYCQITNQILFYAQIFVGCLPASKYSFVYATPDQTTTSWIISTQKMFEFFGGTPNIIICDNPKSLINKASFSEPEIQQQFNFFGIHYNTAIIPARVRKPKDKPLVENTVGNVQRQILARIRDLVFYSIAELNLKLAELNTDFSNKTMKQYGKSRLELFIEIEKNYLNPLPQIPYKLTEFKEAKVHIDYHVLAGKKLYSVPYQFSQKVVQVRLTSKTVEVYHENSLIAQHLRQDYSKSSHITLKEHMPNQHKFMTDWSPERFLSWSQSIGRETYKQIETILSQRQFPQQAYRSCLGVLGLANKYSKDKLEQACAIANSHNCFGFKNINLVIKNSEFKKCKEPNTQYSFNHENIRGIFH